MIKMKHLALASLNQSEILELLLSKYKLLTS